MYFDAKEFGKRLHDVRTSRGITQEELAVRLGLASKQHVSRMENGERSCSIDLLIELSCILHVSTDYLLMGSEPSKEEVKNDLLSIHRSRSLRSPSFSSLLSPYTKKSKRHTGGFILKKPETQHKRSPAPRCST